ncbi:MULTISPECIES: RNA polymerase sigma factor [Gabonibacter]|uniref:RNA polymerase sigma factor n=1 Tax=Gabonibacter TaxID=1911312 RepID=UPI002570047C|nr:RNA polymerase sigma-70 factor [Gabonibacter massiliensis]MCR9011891.1 RNA polymerase sigma-70 factor [Gabonibacter chumensis]
MYAETDIIKSLKQGDPLCVKMMFDNYYQALSVYVLRYIDSFQDAEDLVQDVFISFWENKKGTRFVGSVRGYLFGSVKKAALKFLERSGRFIFEEIENHLNSLPERLENLSEEEIRLRQHRLQKEIDRLPEKCREVFVSIVLEDMSYKEVAQKLSVSMNTVKTHYSRALKQLREELDAIVLLLLRH